MNISLISNPYLKEQKNIEKKQDKINKDDNENLTKIEDLNSNFSFNLTKIENIKKEILEGTYQINILETAKKMAQNL